MSEDSEDQDDKQHDASEQRLRKAREKGDVPSSREAGTFMTLLGLTMAFVFVMPILAPRLMRTLQAPFNSAGIIEIGEQETGVADLENIMANIAFDVGIVLGPLLGTLLLAAIIAIGLQGETVVSLERIKPQISRLSPMGGLNKLFSKSAFIEFGKNVAKVIVVGSLGVWAAWNAVSSIWGLERVFPERLMPLALEGTVTMLGKALIFLIVVAGADNLWQRMKWRKKLRMSHQEMKEEFKQNEGDPHVKGRRRQIAREMARQRIATAVPMANVILTNPTHYAVALRYEQGKDLAPVCVAKGADLVAARIREIARENNIPIIENRPLARALYDAVQIDQMIPTTHWQAVAEIIGYIMDIKANRRRFPPEGSSLRLEP